MSKKSKWFFWSDTHFHHAKVLSYSERTTDHGQRFETIEQMNEFLIDQWNSVVTNRDHVCVAGDLSFKNPADILSRLNGNIHLVLGNHDSASEKLVKKIEKEGHIKNPFASVSERKKIKLASGQKVFVSHYPIVFWPGKERMTWHVFGHVHGEWIPDPYTTSRHKDRTTLVPKVRYMPNFCVDVGVDAHLSRSLGTIPISEDELKSHMDKIKAWYDASKYESLNARS